MNITKDDVPYIVREEITRDIFLALRAHFNEGGTYRYLIYNRLGFKPASYVSLMPGLDLNNAAHDLAEYKKRYGELNDNQSHR